jgi:energy-coupling factor transport system ATP-binding protein
MPSIIELKDVWYQYNPNTPLSFWALKGINLQINEGEFVAIIGPTGSGKSTLIQHFNGLLRPTKGQVIIDGVPINKDTNLKFIRKKIGMVFQYPENQIFSETIYDELAFGLRNYGCPEDEIREKIEKAIGKMGISYLSLDRSPLYLSGGEMRRIAIASILAMEPEVFVLDEPLANLDPQGRKELLTEIDTLNKNESLTVIIISHDLSEIARYANRIIVLNEGKIIMDGAPKEIFKDVEKLIEISLGVPQIVEVLYALYKRGADIPYNIVDIDEAVRYILKWRRSLGDRDKFRAVSTT